MGARSRGLFQLRPVIFRYKQDPQGVRQYGLIAEEVAKVYPELVTWRSDGAAESVQYHELIPMVLNELQRQQRELGELKAQNERLQAALVRQTAALAVRLGRLEGTHTAPLASR
jgi:Chaperone of endosialidase